MRPFRSTLVCLWVLAVPAFPGAGEPPPAHPLAGVILDVASGERLDAPALAARLAEADIVVLGEVHDNAEQHRRQAWLMTRLDPAGVAFEMVPAERTEPLAALAEEARDAAAWAEAMPEALDWADSGWPDWTLYRPVFEAAHGARLVGAGVARDALLAAVRDGAAAAFGAGAEPAGLTEPLPEAVQAEAVEEMRFSHCDALPEELLPGMVEAQRLRDARFAAAALEALEAGAPAVLITGNGHARTDRGVPAYLARMAPEARVLSLGQIEVGEDAAALADDAGPDGRRLPYDFVWFSRPAEREDPCAAFAG